MGVCFFFGLLAYLIILRESKLILDVYDKYSANTAGIIARSLKEHMLSDNPGDVTRYINSVNNNPFLKVGVIGPDGKPAFGSLIIPPSGLLSVREDVSVKTADTLIFYKPLANEAACSACHNPLEKMRGAILVENSLEDVNAEIRETARRVAYFAFFLGFLSEIFLIVVLRGYVLKPVGELATGAANLKAGNLGYRVKLDSDDEMGALADSFNEMAEHIEDARTNLETAVRQKTRELRVVSELSLEVFKGDLTLKGVIEQFLSAITGQLGYSYATICLADKETGLLLQEFKHGIGNGMCSIEIPLAGDHAFARAIREARPMVRHASDLSLPDAYTGSIAVIPILSHQRKRCREVNLCTYENCPAFSARDERCWLVEGTLCRSPQSVAGKEKIYGCLHCSAFPVLGVLVAGREGEVSKSSLNSLEILASEVASAVENQRVIESKREDISSLIKLHDISIDKLQALDSGFLTKAIVSSAVTFANMDAAILWLGRGDGNLYFSDCSRIDPSVVPDSIPIYGSFVGKSIVEERPIETVKVHDAACIGAIIEKYEFLYVATVPLRFRDEIYGCLTLFKRRDFFMTDSEKAVMLLFAVQAAAAINTSRVHGELKAEKEFSDAVFSNVGMGVMVVDAGGQILKINPAGFDVFGIQDYVIGKKMTDVIPEAGDLLVHSEDVGREVEVTRGDGTRIYVGFNNSLFYDASGLQNGFVIVFRDLTEIKRLQADLRKKQHFETMGKVVAGVAHEIRNPLFGISSLVQILERDIKGPQQRALLQAVFKEVRRMKNLIDELLLYSRPAKPNVQEMDLAAFLEKVAGYVRAKNDGVVFEASVPPDVRFKGDSDKLMQVFLNLVDNSINAGSRLINVTAGNDGKNGTVLVAVKDDGPGIKKENLEKIFDPFFTTRSEGTGLGLSICKKLVEDHGGNIEVESEEGRGTTIKLSFPLGAS